MTTKAEKEQFDAERRSAAAAQNLPEEHGVAEKRPQSFMEVRDPHNALTKRLIEEGEIPDPANPEPMGPEAYEAADDDARKKKTAKQGQPYAPHVGTVILVKSGPHRDRKANVLRVVSYNSTDDLLKRMQGVSDADYIQPKEVEVSFRGDSRDGERAILDLSDTDFELLPQGHAGRASVTGAL